MDPATVNGMNEFNLEIAEQRIDKLWNKAMQLLESSRSFYSNLDDVVLWLGGDLINGYIHEENLETNSLGPAEAIGFVQERITAGINFILEHADITQLRVS